MKVRMKQVESNIQRRKEKESGCGERRGENQEEKLLVTTARSPIIRTTTDVTA